MMYDLPVYFMENDHEVVRLELKVSHDHIRQQAEWCGIAAGQRILDAGCGPGKITAILGDMVTPQGAVVGIDTSRERIRHARDVYGGWPHISFHTRSVTDDLHDLGEFDVVWSRFLLEYYRRESTDIVRNLESVLRPGGVLCLLDVDHNCLNNYELPPRIAALMPVIIERLEEMFNFDPYAGRKLYSYVYDMGYRDIRVTVVPHYIYYGEVPQRAVFDWMTKIDIVATKMGDLFRSYPGGGRAFVEDCRAFFLDPRRFSYGSTIVCCGTRPRES